MTETQNSLSRIFEGAPSGRNGMGMQFGRVVAVQRDQHTVDVALMGGGTLKGIPVLSGNAGSHEGSSWLPDVAKYGLGYTNDAFEPNVIATGDKDTYAVVGYVGGNMNRAIVLGFIFPEHYETSFANIDVDKKVGGSYVAYDADGFEISRPDGTYIRIGTSSARVTDSNTNRDSTSVPFTRTSGTAVGAPHIFISHSSGMSIDITPAGTIVLTKAGGGSFELLGHVHSDPQGGTTGAPQ